jgi:hypothetical protein
MSFFAFIGFCVVAIVVMGLFKFFNEDQKDKQELNTQPLKQKFEVLINLLNITVFESQGTVQQIRSDEIVISNVFNKIYLYYFTGDLTVRWEFKTFQMGKAIVIKEEFRDMRNIDWQRQEQIIQTLVNKMDMEVARQFMN